MTYIFEKKKKEKPLILGSRMEEWKGLSSHFFFFLDQWPH